VFLLPLLPEHEWDALTGTACAWKRRHWPSSDPACSRAGLRRRNAASPLTRGVRWCCGLGMGCRCNSPYLFPCKIGCTFLQGRNHFLEYQERDGPYARYPWGGGREEGARETRAIGRTKRNRFGCCRRKRLSLGQGVRGAGCPGRLCQLALGGSSPEGSQPRAAQFNLSAEPAVARPGQGHPSSRPA